MYGNVEASHMTWAGPAERRDTDEAAPDGQIDELVVTDKWTRKLH